MRFGTDNIKNWWMEGGGGWEGTNGKGPGRNKGVGSLTVNRTKKKGSVEGQGVIKWTGHSHEQ